MKIFKDNEAPEDFSQLNSEGETPPEILDFRGGSETTLRKSLKNGV